MNKLKPGIVLLIIALGFLLVFYRDVIFSPNAYLFSDSGDGIKNYYTYYYHIVHDTSYVDFAGMNYPYGEHFLYTDCHPVLADLFKLLNVSGIFTQYAIGVLNLLMLLSVFLTFFLVYRIQLEFDINKWLATLFAIGISLMAPQIFRMGGHFALSYSMAIPLSWLLMIKYVKTRRPGFIIGLTVSNVFWIFIHSYLGMILLSFQFAFFVLFIIWDKYNRKSLYFYLNLIRAVFLPILLFYLLLLLTDSHDGRTNNPSGFFLYNAEFDDVFIPHHPPLRPVLDNLLGPIINLKWEAWSYVGLSTTFVFLFLLILAIISIFKKVKRISLATYFDKRVMNISLLAAFVVLLFAMAFPFKMFPALLEVIPVLKQFRATGRFAWVFYFVATVYGAYVFQLFFSRYLENGKPIIGYLIILIAGIFMVVEAIPYHSQMSNSITQSSNKFNKAYLSASYLEAIEIIDAGEFQAILPLPFYYQGSESYARPRNDEIMKASMIISAQTGLPMFGANLTRTAIPESKKIVQLVSPSFYEKPIQNDLPNDKPILIITTNDPVTKYEQEIIEKAHNIYESGEINLFIISVDDFFESNAEQYLNTYYHNKETLVKRNQFLISDSTSFLFYESFDNNKGDYTFKGNGAYMGTKKGKNIMAEFGPGSFKTGKHYSISCWMYNGYKDALNLYFQLRVEEFDESKNTWKNTIYFPDQSEVINGDWSLVEMEFTINNPDSYLYIVTKGKEDSKPPFIADELLIRESQVDVYKMDTTSNTLFYNNHEIKF